jgi:hypothetical protein
MTDNIEINDNESSEDDDLNDALLRWEAEEADSYQSGIEDGKDWAVNASIQPLKHLDEYIEKHGWPECLKDLAKAIGNDEIDGYSAENDNPEYVEGFVTSALKILRKWEEYKSKK